MTGCLYYWRVGGSLYTAAWVQAGLCNCHGMLDVASDATVGRDQCWSPRLQQAGPAQVGLTGRVTCQSIRSVNQAKKHRSCQSARSCTAPVLFLPRRRASHPFE